MASLAGRLRSRGVHASTSNFFSWSRVADRIARDYRSGRIRAPIVIVGHSLGANGALHMAQRLAREDIPVRLLVIFDATEAVPVPRNVADVINFYQPGGWGKPLRGGNGFRGAIRNEAIGRDAGIHSTVDQNDRLHSRVVARVLSLLQR